MPGHKCTQKFVRGCLPQVVARETEEGNVGRANHEHDKPAAVDPAKDALILAGCRATVPGKARGRPLSESEG